MNELTDKNGKIISEGDVCRFIEPSGELFAVIRGNYGLMAIQKEGIVTRAKERLSEHSRKYFEVVGNAERRCGK